MLTPAQAAFLAGLPQRPSGFNPYPQPRRGHAPAADGAQAHAVGRRADASGARARRGRSVCASSRAPSRVPRAALRRDGASPASGRDRPARIETTLDAATAARRRRHHREPSAGARPARRRQTSPSSCSTTRPASGSRGKDRATTSDAEHGGTINGPRDAAPARVGAEAVHLRARVRAGFTPASVLADVPSHFPTAEAGVLYSPRNYDGRYRGPLLARRALAGSENVPAVALASELGVPTLLRFLTRAGLSTLDRTPSLLRPRPDARQRRGAARRARRRLRDVRARRRVARADAGRSARRVARPAQRTARAGCSSRRAPRSGSPTSSRTPTRASSSSAAAAASSSRFRSRSRPARRRRITTTGPSAIPATSPSASGSATSIARRCAGLDRRDRRRRRSSTP